MITLQPYKYSAAWNRIPIETDNSQTVFSSQNTGVIPLASQSISNYFKYEISPLVRRIFSDDSTQIVTDTGIRVSEVHRLFNRYSLISSGVTSTYYALNAIVRPFTEDRFTNLKSPYSLEDRFLTRFKTQFYYGYPMTLTWFNTDGGYFLYNGTTKLVTPQYNKIHNTIDITSCGDYIMFTQEYLNEIDLTANTGETITANDSVNIVIQEGVYPPYTDKVSINCGGGCEDLSNTLWVRWINDLGGFDYYLFKNIQVNKAFTSDSANFDFVNNYEGYRYLYNGKEVRSFSVGDDNISQDTAFGLSFLQSSNFIHFWDTTLQQWIRLTQNNTTNTITRGNNSFSIELAIDNSHTRV